MGYEILKIKEWLIKTKKEKELKKSCEARVKKSKRYSSSLRVFMHYRKRNYL